MSLPWDEKQLRWYHAVEAFSRNPWWKEAKSNPNSRSASLLYTGEKRSSHKLFKPEPVIWETARRHPQFDTLRLEFRAPSGPDNEETHRLRQKERLSGLRESGRSLPGLHKRFGELSFLVNAILGYGKLDWTALDDKVRNRIADNMVRSSHALGFPVGAYMTDLLTEKLKFQLIDHELQGKEFPEELEVAQLLRDAHSRGNRLMVLEVDPHSNKAAITKKFDGIFSRWYAGARVGRNYASKLASLGIALPKKLPKSRAKLNWQRLEELEILDGNDKLGFEKRRTFCRVFSQLPFG